jgi:peroxiredoxin family protein
MAVDNKILLDSKIQEYIDQQVEEKVSERMAQLSEGDDTPRLAIVASKGTLDMAYPPLILATTAGSLGWEVGIFFTFYGLDILHMDRHKSLKVGPIGNPAMPPPIPSMPFIKVPNLVGALPGMTAMATTMMKKWMAKANLPTVPEMIDISKDSEVRLFACSTTMGMMGIEEKDLLSGIEVCGATAFLDYAASAKVSMFI